MGFKLQSWFRRRRSREEKGTAMVLTVTEDTPADMLTGSMELLVQLPRDHHIHTERVTIERSTPMMDLLVQIATAHKLAASSYTLQAIGERGLVLPHQPNTPIGALDALQVKLLPKQGTFIPRKTKQGNQPFETTFRLQVHLPRNQLYVSRVSPKMNLGEILTEVCREKNLDRNKYELRHPGNHEEVLDPSLSLQDYNLQEVTLYTKEGQSLGSALSSQDIMALQRQEERRRQQAKQSVFGFMFRKSKESSLSTDSLGGRSVSPARSDETGRSVSPLAPPPMRPQRKRRPAPNPPTAAAATPSTPHTNNNSGNNPEKQQLVISHSRNSSDSSGYHEASVLSDNPDNNHSRMPETLPRRSKVPGKFETMQRKLVHTSQASKSLSNLALTSTTSLSHATSNTSLSSTGIRKKRAAPPPPINRPLSSAISTQALERIVDSEESLTSDMGISKSPSDVGSNSKANSDIAVGIHTPETGASDYYDKSTKTTDVFETRKSPEQIDTSVETARVAKRVDESSPPIPKPRKVPPKPPVRRSNPVESSAKMEYVDCNVGVESKTPTRLLVVDPQRSYANKTTGESQKINDSDDIEKTNENCHEINKSIQEDEKAIEKIENQEEILHVSPKTIENSSTDDRIMEKSNENINNQEKGGKLESPTTNKPKIDDFFEDNDSTSTLDAEHSEKSSEVDENEILEKSASKSARNSEKFKKQTSKTSQKSYEDEVNEKIVLEVLEETLQLSRQNENRKRNERNLEIVENQTSKSLEQSAEDDVNEEFALRVLEETLKSAEIETDLDDNEASDGGSSTASRRSCTIISTIPKCCHLKSCEIGVESHERLDKPMKKSNKSKVFRSQSAFGNFNASKSLEKNNRATNSHPDNFNCALNPNFSPGIVKVDCNNSNSFNAHENHTPNVEYPPFVKENTNLGLSTVNLPQFTDTREIGKADKEDTDLLLQRVSSTLATVLPPADHPSPPSTQSDQMIQKQPDLTPNQTFNSQQDTSDYVSATGEDLSGCDWEYQIPDPPSEFRDSTTSPADLAPTNLQEDFKTPPDSPKPQNQLTPDETDFRKIPDLLKIQKLDTTPVSTSQTALKKSSDESHEQLKKEIITELETKIETGLISQKSIDETKKIAEKSSPTVAPVDNTLSNFTITTYSRQKSLNIYDNAEENEKPIFPEASDERIVKTFATLTRNRPSVPSKPFSRSSDTNQEYSSENRSIIRAQSVQDIPEDFKKPISRPLDRFNRPSRQQSDQKSSIVHRSKSYIVLSDPSKYREDKKPLPDVVDHSKIYKSTSFTSLNRENLRNDELQSVQVLKSILPQLESSKNRAAELQAVKEAELKSSNVAILEKIEKTEKIPKQTGFSEEKITSAEQKIAIPAPKIESCEKKTDWSEKNDFVQEKKSIDEPKRYKWAGPPAISLGSWSERPSINVQIKHDSDYKFGMKNNQSAMKNSQTGGNKTIVNLNSTSNDVEVLNYGESFARNLPKKSVEASQKSIETSEKIDLSQKMGLKTDIKPIFRSEDAKLNGSSSNFVKLRTFGSVKMEKPVITEVSLKKSVDIKKEEDIKIDTRPVSFAELTQAFGQVNLRNKTKTNSINRHSDYFDSRHTMEYQKPDVNSSQPVKKYTSVIGIHPNGFKHDTTKINNNFKSNVPTVKGFNVKECQELNSLNLGQNKYGNLNKFVQPPPPPTMPVITGVTLKNNKPKSMAVCNKDPRDQLLESIRNFGRDKLRSVNSVS